MEEHVYVDALVKLQGNDGAFKAWMPHDHAVEIQRIGGLAHIDIVQLREGQGRVIPDRLKEGLSCIEDVQVLMQAGTDYCLN